MPHVRAELSKLNHTRVVAGVPVGDSYLQMVASVNETGKIITAKRSWLTIPTAAAGTRKAGDIPGLFKPKGKNILAVANGDQLTVMFYLKKSVTIPTRPFIRWTVAHKRSVWRRIAVQGVSGIIRGTETADGVLAKLGRTATNDIRMTIRDMADPANAPVTVERKGSNNPLMDTGKLIKSITWTKEGM
ncbi:hypothetical protein FD13_GL000309 [Levilactobacillus senmaizukei DSM 21775 = NBRC 103853]|uniref:Uncharacterized protein n=2 Tax=Levilactobacillus senmaizukei TaxID=431273 RepID=A0A0R2DE54_9LACO|nr:hypothetical protein [Levilactobacillus senmaizukei]KRN02169.1 hypothetical protein FD13_GL000309 [Levilactobacillus senmaizukei DSM 21775 = NBRC 103853]